MNSSILPRKMPKKTVKPPVHWTPNSTPVQERKRTRLGTRLGCPQLSSTTKGTEPCVGSALVRKGNSGGPRMGPQFSLVPGNHQGGCYLLLGLAQ